MGEPPPGTPPSAKPVEDRLDSWKEIAAYLKRDVTTVQRWEKREGMPVHRHVHDSVGSVYAFRTELDRWVQSRKPNTAEETGNHTSSPSPAAAAPGRPQSASATRWKILLLLLGAGAVLVIAVSLWIQRKEYFYRSPIAGAKFQKITDFEAGVQEAAAVSRDGHFVAFLSDRDGPMDVWVTQIGSGEFHNLTRGSAPELVNPSIRTLGFSPDGAFVTFWVRKKDASGKDNISVWAVPTLGGQLRPYLEGAAEFDWSPDGSKLAYHTPGPGDPLFVTDGRSGSGDNPIFTAPEGFHSHFPVWGPDAEFIYFVQGTLPDKLDVWRISPKGGNPERITAQTAWVSHPELLDRRTLLYLATDTDGSGPWLYSMDVNRRIAHRLTSGLDRYTSLSSSADGRRLVATTADPKRTLWQLPILSSGSEVPVATRISLTTNTGFSPRFGPDYLLYISANNDRESIWKLANGASTELWGGPGAEIIGGPAIGHDGKNIAFGVRQRGQSLLYVVEADGTKARIVSDALEMRGGPAWAPDDKSITVAAVDHGVPHLYRVPVDGGSPQPFVQEYSVDPTWAPDGHFLVCTGPDIGTSMTVKAITSEGAPLREPSLTLTRGARHLAFLPGGRALLFLRGEIQHKNLWLIKLDKGEEK